MQNEVSRRVRDLLEGPGIFSPRASLSSATAVEEFNVSQPWQIHHDLQNMESCKSATTFGTILDSGFISTYS